MVLKDIYKQNNELAKQLLDKQCVIYIGKNVLYEGILNNANLEEYTDPKTVCLVDLGDKKLPILVNVNESVNELHTFATIDNILETKVYNKAMGLANKLPMYNIINENELSNEDKIELRKRGAMYKVVMENLLLNKS